MTIRLAPRSESTRSMPIFCHDLSMSTFKKSMCLPPSASAQRLSSLMVGTWASPFASAGYRRGGGAGSVASRFATISAEPSRRRCLAIRQYCSSHVVMDAVELGGQGWGGVWVRTISSIRVQSVQCESYKM